MRNLIIVLVMLLTLFGPTAIFTLVGYKAMIRLGERPSDSAGIMISLLVSVVITSAVLIGSLIGLLKAFA